MKETINKLFKEYIVTNRRMPFLAWAIFPVALAWFSVNYIAGYYDSTSWEKLQRLTEEPGLGVMAAQQNITPEPLEWSGGGLVTLWFDDAWYSQYKPTLNMLESYGFNGTVAVPTELVGFEAYMTWPHIKKLKHLGWEVTAHSRDHTCTEEITMDEAEFQVVGSLQDLRAQGIEPTFYVYTCGIITEELEKVVKEEFEAARTVEWGLNPIPVKDPYNLKVIEINPSTRTSELAALIAEADDAGQWLIFMFHQIDDEMEDYSSTPEQLDQILKVIYDSGVPVVVPSQVLNVVPV